MVKFDTKFFFTSAAVIAATDKATRSVLSKFGSYVRRAAQQSIRKRKKSSAPGQAPSSHEGTLKRLVFFVWQPASRSVVVGPADLSSKPGDAPATLEKGGRIAVKRKGRPTKIATVQARPYMGPALQKRLPELPALWRNSIKK